MRSMDKPLMPTRYLAACMVPVLGGSVLAACSSGASGSKDCLTTPVLSPVYEGSLNHKGVVVTVPPLGSQAIGLDVGFRAASGQWNDSDPVPESSLAHAGQRVVVGIKDGSVQFRFAEVFPSGQGNYQALGRVGLSAQTTEQAQPWLAVSDQGVLPTWPTEPVATSTC